MLALVLGGAVIAVGQLLWHGFTMDIPPVQDHHDDHDPWLAEDT